MQITHTSKLFPSLLMHEKIPSLQPVHESKEGNHCLCLTPPITMIPNPEHENYNHQHELNSNKRSTKQFIKNFLSPIILTGAFMENLCQSTIMILYHSNLSPRLVQNLCQPIIDSQHSTHPNLQCTSKLVPAQIFQRDANLTHKRKISQEVIPVARFLQKLLGSNTEKSSLYKVFNPKAEIQR